jgi:hypothetical protein
MPDTFGKRQRNSVKVRKAAAREERRVARNRRRANREAGLPEDYDPDAPVEAGDDGLSEEQAGEDQEQASDVEEQTPAGPNT